MLKIKEKKEICLYRIPENPQVPEEGLSRERKIEIAAELFSSPIEEKVLGGRELSSLSFRARRAISVATFARMMNEGRRYLLIASATRPQAIETGVVLANLSEEAGTHYVHLTDEMAKENGELNGVKSKVEEIRDFFTQEIRTLGKH